ncbi:MAG: ComF family protein [Cryomorphaceae bacterium]|nr:ComF family protein [Cryomorphaceae bacterium]MBL6682053.1 ComF family protein [Cryomorphaceae bacterium]
MSVLEQSLCQFCLCSAPQLDTIAAQRTMLLSSTLSTDRPTSFRSALYFTGPVQIYCYSLKYGNNYPLGVVLGRHFLSPLILTTLAGQRRPVVVTAMPVHLWRRLGRGYNQSEALARGALQGVRAAGVDVQFLALLKKTAHRKSQINFDPFQRWNNTQGALRTTTKKRVPKDALIFIIDDTVTTGSSLLRAAEAVLLEYPKAEVHLLALAQEL